MERIIVDADVYPAGLEQQHGKNQRKKSGNDHGDRLLLFQSPGNTGGFRDTCTACSFSFFPQYPHFQQGSNQQNSDSGIGNLPDSRQGHQAKQENHPSASCRKLSQPGNQPFRRKPFSAGHDFQKKPAKASQHQKIKPRHKHRKKCLMNPEKYRCRHSHQDGPPEQPLP